MVALSSIPLYGLVRQEYVPSDVDEAEFEGNINAPEGTSLAAMDEAMRRIEQEIRQIPGVRLVLATVGGSFLGAVNQGQLYVRIAPHEERLFSIGRLFRETLKLQPWKAFEGNYSQRDVMAAGAAGDSQLSRTCVAGRATCSRSTSAADRSRSTSRCRDRCSRSWRGTPRNCARRRRIWASSMPTPRSSSIARSCACRSTASARPTSTWIPRTWPTALRLLVGGDDEVTRYRDVAINDDYDVQLRLDDADRRDTATIGRLLVPSRDGSLIRLDNLVTIEQSTSPSRVDRLDRQRDARLRGNVAQGFALADRLVVIRQAADDMDLPAGYIFTIGGRGKELEKTFVEFLWAFSLSVIFMYMILAAQFESVIHPFTILLSLPLSVPFALLSLWATGNTLNLFSALGLLVLFGVVKKNSILQIDHMNNLRAQGMPRHAGDHPGQSRSSSADPDDDAGAGGRHVAAGAGHRPRGRGTAHHRRGRHRRPDAVAVAHAAGHARGVFGLRGPDRDRGLAPPPRQAGWPQADAADSRVGNFRISESHQDRGASKGGGGGEILKFLKL